MIISSRGLWRDEKREGALTHRLPCFGMTCMAKKEMQGFSKIRGGALRGLKKLSISPLHFGRALRTLRGFLLRSSCLIGSQFSALNLCLTGGVTAFVINNRKYTYIKGYMTSRSFC